MENNHQKKQTKFKYSILTVVLLICIIELTVSVVQNISKNITFSSKIKGLVAKRDEELNKNKQLKADIQNSNSERVLESIARNNLKMAGKDEILVIVNKTDKSSTEEVLNNQKNKNRKTAH